ncbi:carbamoyl-phosphate synthase domain-containing protein, partial [Streptomyces sp. SID12488]|uniref:carbamoyl-phosphate synthase domain-containing protein n=1 Tax=Streptomyces sp. SID12488 TaxID=2706040 RepID=UPI0013FC1822
WRSRRSLDEELAAQGVVGISDVDTRALTRHLRERGVMRAGIFSGDALVRPEGERPPVDELVDEVLTAPAMTGADLAGEVSVDAAYVVPALGLDGAPLDEPRARVAAVDLGIKAMTPQCMAERGVEVHVLPATSTIADVAEAERD